jgi:hypothetical protein
MLADRCVGGMTQTADALEHVFPETFWQREE